MNLSAAKGSAVGQYLGYALQPVRLFYHLVSGESDVSVALEYADDVSVHSPNGNVLVEQCKSAITGNPVSNWAEDLWKTFDLWIVNSGRGIYDLDKTRFQLYVTPIRGGELVQKLSDANDEVEIRKLITEIESKRKKVSSTTKSAQHLNNILAANRDVLVKIIQNFKFISEHENPLAPIYTHLDATVTEETIAKACSYGIGDAEGRIERLVKSGASPIIVAEEFRKKFRAFVNKHDASNVLHSLADQPNSEVVKDTLSNAPPFVQQLKLIDASVEDTTRAASDYLRSSADRTLWAEEGHMFADSIDEYNETLKSRFSYVRGETEILHRDADPIVRGGVLYYKCCQIPPIPLEGSVVPGYFLSGSLNDLANQKEIGWHPDYASLMAVEPKE